MQPTLNCYPSHRKHNTDANVVEGAARSAVTIHIHNKVASSTDDTENRTTPSLRVREKSGHLRSLQTLCAADDEIIELIHEIGHSSFLNPQKMCSLCGNTTPTTRVQWFPAYQGTLRYSYYGTVSVARRKTLFPQVGRTTPAMSLSKTVVFSKRCKFHPSPLLPSLSQRGDVR